MICHFDNRRSLTKLRLLHDAHHLSSTGWCNLVTEISSPCYFKSVLRNNYLNHEDRKVHEVLLNSSLYFLVSFLFFYCNFLNKLLAVDYSNARLKWKRFASIKACYCPEIACRQALMGVMTNRLQATSAIKREANKGDQNYIVS